MDILDPENARMSTKIFQDWRFQCLDPRTTVIVRNLPNRRDRDWFVRLILSILPDGVNVIYLPIDFRRHHNFGYGFVDVKHPSLIAYLMTYLHRVQFTPDKCCWIEYAHLQGQDAIECWLNMRVPPQYAPVWFIRFEVTPRVLPIIEPEDSAPPSPRSKCSETSSD
jgi:hypothetical protein